MWAVNKIGFGSPIPILVLSLLCFGCHSGEKPVLLLSAEGVTFWERALSLPLEEVEARTGCEVKVFPDDADPGALPQRSRVLVDPLLLVSGRLVPDLLPSGGGWTTVSFFPWSSLVVPEGIEVIHADMGDAYEDLAAYIRKIKEKPKPPRILVVYREEDEILPAVLEGLGVVLIPTNETTSLEEVRTLLSGGQAGGPSLVCILDPVFTESLPHSIQGEVQWVMLQDAPADTEREVEGVLYPDLMGMFEAWCRGETSPPLRWKFMIVERG
ncbi:hypothetical protein Spith_1380 [Spirochaeta thermophila DSM 6578]|uniref:Uncharacterized protein n=1 Tax=Winmispira thermophila (strain ATCC 700085 / DSM 6578 / Z-1203) TaxID=869211 RepID=G0GFV1_WINT7|nr:hypothetical protein [Spirochaeta thermophila]AEJ61644.1 hypothetical protein Spith_1380 [Spirochaeta thermophila DSM 6578]